MANLKGALIGCGGMGRNHATAVQQLGVELVGFCDVIESAAEHARQEYGGRYATTDSGRIMRDDSIDILYIATHHDAHYPLEPDHIAIIAQGTRRLGPKNLAVLALYHWFNRPYASHPMPHQLEGFKMSNHLGISTDRVSRNLIWTLILAIFTSVVSTFWLILDSFYQRGSASGFYNGWGSGGFGRETFR